LLLANPMGFD